MTSTFVPISRQRHGQLRWKRPQDYSRAANSALLPLVISELIRAQTALVIGLVADKDSFRPVGMAGLKTGKSLLVAPDGRWLARYVPACLRGFPFAIGNSQDEQKILLVLEPDGMAAEGAGGEPFFVDDKPAPFLTDILNFLIELDRADQATEKAIATLKAHDLIEPWPIRVTIGGKAEDIQGLYRINETRLNQLPPEAFAALRADGAIILAYAQLMSMQHLPDLVKLAEMHAAHETRVPVNQKGELDLEFLNQGGTLNFAAMGT